MHSGLILGPEDCWQFSVIIFAASQMAKSAEGDIKRLMEGHGRFGYGNLSKSQYFA